MVYRFIQLSTALVGMGSFLFDHPALLEVHDAPSLVLAGSLVSLIGLAVFVAAKSALGAHYSPCFDSYVPNAIVRDGIYRQIRHPIYTGNFLVLGGLAVATGSAWIALNFVLLLAYYNVAARTEESDVVTAAPARTEQAGETIRLEEHPGGGSRRTARVGEARAGRNGRGGAPRIVGSGGSVGQAGAGPPRDALDGLPRVPHRKSCGKR